MQVYALPSYDTWTMLPVVSFSFKSSLFLSSIFSTAISQQGLVWADHVCVCIHTDIHTRSLLLSSIFSTAISQQGLVWADHVCTYMHVYMHTYIHYMVCEMYAMTAAGHHVCVSLKNVLYVYRSYNLVLLEWTQHLTCAYTYLYACMHT